MKSHHRPLSNRRKWRRQRTVRTVLIVVASMLLLFFVGFVIVGNLLLKKTALVPETNEPQEQPVIEEVLPRPQRIQAYPVVAETKDTTTFSSRLKKWTDQGISAITVPMNTESGDLLYHSPVAATIGLTTADDYTVTVPQIVKTAKDSGVYVNGYFYLNAFGEEDPLLRSVALSQAAAVTAEAILSGMDEVLFLIPDLGAEHTAELNRFLDEVRLLAPDATLGVAISQSLLSDTENREQALAAIRPHVNFMALDATYADPQAADGIDAIIHDTQTHYLLLYYEMRLLLPMGADDVQTAEIVAAVIQNGLEDFQLI